jgi:hypothetical protein
MVRPQRVYQTIPAHHEVYLRAFQAYRSLAQALENAARNEGLGA